MNRRRSLLAAALLAIVVAPAPAFAAWNGLKAFDCEVSAANWHFDGLYGRDTTEAVKAFQRGNNLPVTGVTDRATAAALGVPYKRNLTCGTGGNDVLVVQRSLAAKGYWAGQAGHPRPAATPTPKPTPMWTPAPRPTPMWTPAPTPMPTPESQETPMPMATESPEDMSGNEVTNMPTFDLRGGTWMIPTSGFWYVPLGGTSYNYDFSLIRQNPWVSGDLWMGNWGIGGDWAQFNLANPVFSGPLFTNGVQMYDAHLDYRWDSGFWKAFAGYRGLNVSSLNFGTLGLAYEHPIAGEWLWWNAKLQGGSNFGSSYFADGQLGLDAHMGPVGVGLAFRNMYMGINGAPAITINGPTAGLELKF